MCFSYAVNFSQTQLQTQLDLNKLGPVQGQPEIPHPGFFLSGFAHPLMPIVSSKEGQTLLENAHWGLVPSWAASAEKARELATMGLNARSETVAEKPLFRGAWKRQACLVPMTGFFEWKQEGKRKLPHFIYAADQSLLLAAGINDVWSDPETGEQVQTFSILTTEANALMAEIHNVKKRMPVFLQGATETQRWLQGRPEERFDLLKPASDTLLNAHRVADFVSRAGEDRNRVECQKAFDEPRQASLF